MTSDAHASQAAQELQQIIDSARRLGVEVDEAEALQWLSAMAAESGGEEVVVDQTSGVYGHRVSMLDFSPRDLARFRAIGQIVEFADEPGVVETALALSGSAAQSKIQTYPGDCDYFERVNIIAPTRAEACRILARIMRDKALGAARGPNYQLIELKFGSYPETVVRANGDVKKKGSPIAWTLAEVRAGGVEGKRPDGTDVTVGWYDVAHDPGWCKLDWVISDPQRATLANASNMLDVTWEGPDGAIVPLDGYLDGYFQEVYLDAASIPLFAKLQKHVSANALDDYVTALEHEVQKYLAEHPNYGKAAKRMYNVFRLTGRYPEAAYIRELFDEPATLLYQVWSLIKTIDDTIQNEQSLPAADVIAQADELITMVVKVLEGDEETTIVRALLHLRDALGRPELTPDWTAEMEGVRDQVINLVNNFFHERLTVMPTIKAYMDRVLAPAAAPGG